MDMDKGARQLGRRMLAVYRELEPRTQQMAKDVGSTCREGCSACCNIQVYVSLPEAVAIVEPFLADQNALADLIRRCHDQLAYQKLDRTEHFAQSVPCVFLTGVRTCGIYDRRPVSCRNHIVVSPPENCAYNPSPAADAEVRRLNTDKLDNFMLGEALRALKQRQIPVLLAPIPVAVLWAIRLLAEGEHAFIKALESPEDLGILDIRGWTSHALKMEQAESRIVLTGDDRTKQGEGSE